VSYQEMGLDRGMELSTLGKVFISLNPDLEANTSELETLENLLVLCFIVCRGRS